jgi:competence protein ComEA
MGSFLKHIYKYLDISKSERLAIYFLLFLIFLNVFFKHCSHLFFSDKKVDFSQFEKMIAEFELNNQNIDNLPEIESMVFYDVDINDMNYEQLVKMGCHESIAKRIVNYRNHFKGFKSKNELYKIYGIDTVWLREIWSKLVLKSKQTDQTKPQSQFPAKINIELNSCDTNDLKQLKGIGSTLSKRIIFFRSRLGGFYSIQQLSEVYGLKPEVLEHITTKLTLDTGKIVKFNINDTENDSLYLHPYMSYKQFKTIKMYRQQHGRYKDVKDVEISKAFKEEELRKILKYIYFGP